MSVFRTFEAGVCRTCRVEIRGETREDLHANARAHASCWHAPDKDCRVVKPTELRDLWRQGVARMELDKVRLRTTSHVYEDEDGLVREHVGACTDVNCHPYHRFVCRDCTDTQPCERMRALMGETG